MDTPFRRAPPLDATRCTPLKYTEGRRRPSTGFKIELYQIRFILNTVLFCVPSPLRWIGFFWTYPNTMLFCDPSPLRWTRYFWTYISSCCTISQYKSFDTFPLYELKYMIQLYKMC